MSRNYSIYVLKEPNTDLVRYVGLTGRRLEERLNEHLRDGRNTRRKSWITKLKNSEQVPDVDLLEDNLTFEEAIEKEIFWHLYTKRDKPNC